MEQPTTTADEVESIEEEVNAGPVRIITRLAELPGKALLDEGALAEIFVVSKRTVRRMVERFELPPPVSLAGRSVWIADRVIAHLEHRAEREARKAEQESRRIEALPYRAEKS